MSKLSSSLLPAALLAAALASASCSSLHGELSGGVYRSPADNFAVPVIDAGGARVRTLDEFADDGEVLRGEVTFVGPLRAWDRILYFQLSDAFRPPTLESAFELLMLRMLPPEVEPAILARERLELPEQALFILLKTPDYYGPGQAGAEGCLLFERDDFLYLLTRADGPALQDLKGLVWDAERIASDRDRLVRLAQSMTWTTE